MIEFPPSSSWKLMTQSRQPCEPAHSLMHDTAPTELLVEDEKSVSEQITLTEEDAAEARAMRSKARCSPPSTPDRNLMPSAELKAI